MDFLFGTACPSFSAVSVKTPYRAERRNPNTFLSNTKEWDTPDVNWSGLIDIPDLHLHQKDSDSKRGFFYSFSSKTTLFPKQ